MIMKNTALVITCAADLVAAYSSVAPNQTGCYTFCVVEEFPVFLCERAEQRAEVKIPGICQLHQITYRDRGLKTRKLSCLLCLRLQRECEECSQQEFTITSDKLTQLLGTGDEEEQEGGVEEAEAVFELEDGEEVLEQTDGESDTVKESDIEEEDDEREVRVGDIVWGLCYGKQAPARVVELVQVPEGRRMVIKSRKVGVMYLQWIGLEDKFAASSREQLVLLGSTPKDLLWGLREPNRFQAAQAAKMHGTWG